MKCQGGFLLRQAISVSSPIKSAKSFGASYVAGFRQKSKADNKLKLKRE